MDTGNKSNNKVIIVLLSVLIVAVLGIGGFFIVKSLNNNNQKTNESSTNTSTSENTQKPSNNSTTPTNTTTDDSASPIEAGFTYTEVRNNNYYIEVQTNGAITGTCDISIVPTNGTEGHHDTDDLEVYNKVSLCSEDFSLKGMNPGEHKITVIIRATDGRTATLEKIVNI